MSNEAEAFNQQLENRKPKQTEADPKSQSDKQASREGKKSLNAFVEPEVARQLKKLSADLEKTQQELFIEALNDLFVKYGKAPIA